MPDPTFTRTGCPTDEALRRIEEWPAADPIGWLAFCRACWDVNCGRAQKDMWTDGGVRIGFITGGWSANEAVVEAMARNRLLWGRCWVSSHRGGRYVFEEPVDSP